MTENHEFYSSLNLSTNATDAQIRTNYKKLSRFLHPDKQLTDNKESAEAAFSRLQYYKDILTNSTTRYIYDKYGETGASLAAKRKNITSYKISDLQSQVDLDKKMQDLLLKAHFHKMQNDISHRSTCVLNLSIADYCSSTKSFKRTPWAQKVFLTNMAVDEVVRFSLTPRLVGDLGFVVQSTENDSACFLTGKMTYRFDSGFTGQCSYQVGQTISSTYSISRQVAGVNFYVQAQLANSRISPSVAVVRNLNETAFMRVDFAGGVSPSTGVSIEQTVTDSLKASYTFHSTQTSAELFTSLSYKLTPSTTFRLGLKLLSKQNKKKHLLYALPQCGFSVKLNSLLSFSYSIELDENGLHFISKFRRGDFLLKLPLHIFRAPTPKKILSCVCLAAFATFLTYIIGKSLTSLPGAFSKSNVKKFKEEEKFKEHLTVLAELNNSFKQTQSEEMQKHGLVIYKALFGNIGKSLVPGPDSQVIDITIILQSVVKDSRLFLAPKAVETLSGVFSPCSKPLLYIKFRFGTLLSERLYSHSDAIMLP